MKKFKVIFVGILAIALQQSCNRDSAKDNTADAEAARTEMIELNGKSDFSSDNDLDLAMDVSTTNGAFGKGQSFSLVPPCATVTVVHGSNPGGFPKVITVDFGTTGCTNANGVTKKGKLTITLSNKIMIPGSTMKIERSNYSVNDNKIEGTTVFQNITTDPAIPSWSKTVTAGKITKPNGNYVSFDVVRKQKMISGAATPGIPMDDVYQIYEGTKHLSHNNGNTLTISVTSPLTKAFACQYISKGKLTFVGSNLNGILDYGDGTCDNKATFTFPNGTVINITL